MLLRGGVPPPPPPLSTYVFTFSSFFLFPSEKHRGWGLRGWVSVQSWIGHGWKKKKTTKKRWQVFNKFDAFMITGESAWCSWLPAVDLLGLGKEWGGGEIWSVSAVKVGFASSRRSDRSHSAFHGKVPERSCSWKHITSVWTVASQLHCAV